MKAGIGLALWLALHLLSTELLYAVAPSATLESAILALEHGRFEEALVQVQALRAKSASPAERNRAQYLAGHIALKMKRYPEALHAFGEVLQHYPALGDYAVWNVARIYRELQAERFHLETLRLLLNRFPQSRLIPQARLALARQMIGVTGELADGVRVLEEYVAQHTADPNLPEVYLLLGQAYEGLGLYDKALATYRTLYVRFPSASEADRAIPRVEVLLLHLVRSPRDWLTPQERLQRADQLAEAGECERARRDVQQLPADGLSDGLAASAARRLGLCAFKLRRYHEAIATLEKFRHSFFDDEHAPEALYTLALAYQRDGRTGEAERIFRHLLKQEPASLWSARALVALGLSYEARQDIARAIEAYRELASRFPTASRADELAWRVGWLRYGQGLFSAAAQDFRAAAEQFPQSMFASNALYWQAKALDRNDRRSQALALYAEVTRDYPYTYYGIRAQEVLRARSSPHNDGKDHRLKVTPWITPEGAPQDLAAGALVSEAAQFHRVRVEELVALRFLEDAREELAHLGRHLGDGLSERLLMARLYMQAEMTLQAIRSLNALLNTFPPHERLTLPGEFWTLLFPQLYWAEVRQAAHSTRLDPLLILGVIRQESAFNPRAVSRSDARGLMQLLPSTGREVFRRLGMEAFREELLFEPQVNVRLGAEYLGRLAEAHRGNLILALASYNAGPGRVKRWLQEMNTADWDEFIEQLPFEETRGYVKSVLRNYGIYQRLYAVPSGGHLVR